MDIAVSHILKDYGGAPRFGIFSFIGSLYLTENIQCVKSAVEKPPKQAR